MAPARGAGQSWASAPRWPLLRLLALSRGALAASAAEGGSAVVSLAGAWPRPANLLGSVQLREEGGDEERSGESRHTCKQLDDENGRWEGSVHVGRTYTLQCAPGFQVTGHKGVRIASLSCPENLEWPKRWRCEDVDDCARLKHGCGAKGVCIDLVDGYDCNCEKGYHRRRGSTGEIVCGSPASNDICGGNTCGAYGLCVDLMGTASYSADGKSALNDSDADAKAYRCECSDGFYDNGTYCERRDCGALHDELGTWSGSTLFNREYTLMCREDSFVWGTSLKTITISCARKGKWLTRPFCHSPALEAEDARIESFRFWACLGCVLMCVCSAALAAGLTLGLATLEPFGLTVVMATCPEHCGTKQAKERLKRDQLNAERVLPLVRDHHRLLVTLMLFNTVANEALPIFLDELVPSWAAVLVSVTVVLICGEILPSALFTGPHQMQIAGACVPLVSFLEWLFYYISKPIITILDNLIEQEEHEGSMKYSRAELRALLQLHGQKPDEQEPRHAEEPGRPEDSSHASGNSAGTSALACLLGSHGADERTQELGHGEPGHAESPTVLASSELRLINGALSLQASPLERVPFAKRRHCTVAYLDDEASEVLARNALQLGHRAVLVVSPSSGAEAGRKLERSSSSSLRCPLVTAAEIRGCLRPHDLLRGGHRSLGSLCSEPLVLLPENIKALEALRLLAARGSTAGVVIHGDEEYGTAQGVVTRAEILSFMLTRPCQSMDQSDDDGYDSQETVVPSQNRRRVGHRPLLTRTYSHSLEQPPTPTTSPARSNRRNQTAAPPEALRRRGSGSSLELPSTDRRRSV